MWKTAVLATGLALTLAGIGTTDLAAQGKGHAKGKAKATQRFEERDDRATAQRSGAAAQRSGAAAQRSGATARSATRDSNEPWYRQPSTDRRDGGVYDRNGGVYYPGGSVYNPRDDRDDDGRYEGQGQGPAFCRSGAGHPTKGRQWCYDKGYGLGNERWSRAGNWGDIIFGRPDGRYSPNSMSGSVLQDILGRIVYGRLLDQSRAYGWGGLSGRWLDAAAGPRILQVQAGGHPLAEFYDQNRDGRVDLVMVNRAR